MRRRLLLASRGAAVVAVAAGTVAAKSTFGEERAAVLRRAAAASTTTAPAVTTTSTVLLGVVRPIPEQLPEETMTTTTTLGRRVIAGDIADTEYGPLQVELVMDGPRIVDVRVPIYQDSSERSREINDDALPKLRVSVIDAQSSDIQTISGATVTYEAYKLSVQSALDHA